MSVSGARAAIDIDLEDFERRLRAAGAPSTVEDPLAELARLVEASRPKTAPAPAAPPVVAVQPPPPPPAPAAAPRPQVEPVALRPAFDEAAEQEPLYAEAAETVEASDFAPEVYPESYPSVAAPEAPRSRRWLVTVSALAIAGVAMIGAVFALKGHLPGLQKAPPFIAAAQGPAKVQPPSDATVAASSDAGATLLKDTTQASKVKVIDKTEQPIDLAAQTAPSPPAPAPVASGDGAGGPVVRGTDETPVVLSTSRPAPVATSPFPEPKPVRTVSLRPDGTPIGAGAPVSAVSQTPPSPPAPEPPKVEAKPAPKPPADVSSAQSSTPKLELPTKLGPPKSSARVVVGKTDTTAPAGAAEAVGEPVQLGAGQAKPAKPKAAAAEPATPAAAEPVAASSGGWAVQLAAPRSEGEAKTVVAKLGEKYASALGGSALGVQKASVRGDTVYRVRVNGLSKADAAALCARIKGDGGSCFVAK